MSASGRTPSAVAADREAAERRARLAPGTAAGVTEPMIREVVGAFYAAIRKEPVLAPIFEARIEDWDEHVVKLCDFWSSVLLMTGRFKGAPMRAHALIAEIEPAHFRRWLGLWRETVQAAAPPAAAALFVAKAEMIAQSLQLGLAVSRGQLPQAEAV